MRRKLALARVLLGVGFVLSPVAAMAGGHQHGHHKTEGCTKDLGCWIWSVKEVEETVFDVTYKEVEKTIKVPYIREIKELLPCKACQPVWGQGLRTCPEVDYIRSADTVQVEKCTMPETCDSGCGEGCNKGCGKGCGKSGCGSCAPACPVCEMEPHVKTCLTRVEVSRQFPVTEWQLVPQEVKIPRIYYVRDWKDEVVKLQVPVKTERTIKRKVWDRVPAPKCECSDCCGDAAPAGATPAPSQPVPVDPGA